MRAMPNRKKLKLHVTIGGETAHHRKRKGRREAKNDLLAVYTADSISPKVDKRIKGNRNKRYKRTQTNKQIKKHI